MALPTEQELAVFSAQNSYVQGLYGEGEEAVHTLERQLDVALTCPPAFSLNVYYLWREKQGRL